MDTHPVTGLPVGKQTIRVMDHHADGTVTEGESFEMDWDRRNRDIVVGTEFQGTINAIFPENLESVTWDRFREMYNQLEHAPKELSGANYTFGRIRRKVYGKGGTGFEVGDIVLFCPGHSDPYQPDKTYVTAFSLRTAASWALELNVHVEEVCGP